jgi:trk system potassium uptake protein TrkH
LPRSLFTLGSLLERVLHPTQVIVLSFAGTILVGAILLTTPWAAAGERVPFLDALFTATSACCVTGLVVVDTGTRFSPFGQGVILALIELGGLGIMTYSTVFLVLLRRRLSFRGHAIVEDTLGRKGTVSTDRLIRDVFVYTFAIEAVGALLLTATFARRMPLSSAAYAGVFHSISAFCNAGFSTFSANLLEYRGDWLCNFAVMGLIVTGGLGFTVMEDIREALSKRRAGKIVRLQLHTKVVLLTTAALVAVGCAGIWTFESRNALRGLPWDEQILASLFQSVTPRTAGFNTLDYAHFTNSTLFFTILLMFVGASPGSTGGGVKTSTLAVVLALFRARIVARSRVSLFRRTIPEDTVSRSVAILMSSFLLVTVVTFALLTSETGGLAHYSGESKFIEIMFEAVSAFGTVGLSTGITSSLSVAGKLLITGLMFVGRIGPLTLAIAVGRKAEKGRFQYAEESLMVG